MARTKPAPEPAVPAGVRIQTRGPLGPSTPEVTLHASLGDGALGATPTGYATRMRPVSILVTDEAGTVERIPARTVLNVEGGAHRVAMLRAHFEALSLPIEDRTVAVAGSSAMIEAALDDAYRVVLSCSADDQPPPSIAAWKSSRPKGADVTTLTRD